MLYDSVQHSIAVFNARKKQQQTYQDKQIFKWKIIAMCIFVIAIVLVGVFSQLFKSINSLKIYNYNASYLVSFLNQTNIINSTKNAKFIMKGIQKSTSAKFDNCNNIAKSQISAYSLKQSIEGKNNILFLFKILDQISNQEFIFGMLSTVAYQSSNEKPTIVKQPNNRKQSVIFNGQRFYSLNYNFQDDCSVYEYSQQNSSFVLFQAFQIKQQTLSININEANYRCFTANQSDINFQQITRSLTNLKNNQYSKNQYSLEIFQLYPVSQ